MTEAMNQRLIEIAKSANFFAPLWEVDEVDTLFLRRLGSWMLDQLINEVDPIFITGRMMATLIWWGKRKREVMYAFDGIDDEQDEPAESAHEFQGEEVPIDDLIKRIMEMLGEIAPRTPVRYDPRNDVFMESYGGRRF